MLSSKSSDCMNAFSNCLKMFQTYTENNILHKMMQQLFQLRTVYMMENSLNQHSVISTSRNFKLVTENGDLCSPEVKSFFTDFFKTNEEVTNIEECYRLKLLLLVMFQDLNDEREKCIQLEQKFESLSTDRFSCNKCAEIEHMNMNVKQLQEQIEALKAKNKDLEDELKLPNEQDILRAIEETEEKRDKRMDFKFAKKEEFKRSNNNEVKISRLNRTFEENVNQPDKHIKAKDNDKNQKNLLQKDQSNKFNLKHQRNPENKKKNNKDKYVIAEWEDEIESSGSEYDTSIQKEFRKKFQKQNIQQNSKRGSHNL